MKPHLAKVIPTERRSALISLLSTEVAKMVFAYANPDGPYDVIWRKLEVFARPKPAHMRFWRFQTLQQLSGETVDVDGVMMPCFSNRNINLSSSFPKRNGILHAGSPHGRASVVAALQAAASPCARAIDCCSHAHAKKPARQSERLRSACANQDA